MTINDPGIVTAMAGVPVRGTCKAGHTVETVAPPGRVTWRGECPTQGCDLLVTARRVPPKERAGGTPSTAGESAPAPASAGKKQPRYKVVKGYRSDEPDQHPSFDGGAEGGPDGPPGVRAAPDVDEDDGPAGSDSDDDRSELERVEPRRRGILGRRRRGGGPPPGLGGGDYRVIEGIY